MNKKFIIFIFSTLFLFLVYSNALSLDFKKYDKHYIFWKEAIEELNLIEPDYSVTQNFALSSNRVDVFDVYYTSYENIKIFGYLSVPKKKGSFPGIVMLHGMETIPISHNEKIASKGYVVFTLEMRGFGTKSGGKKYDSSFPLWGIQSPSNHIFKAIILDAYRAVEFISERPEVNEDAIVTRGLSMGGGISLILAAINPKISYVLADVPFFCDFIKSMEFCKSVPYLTIKNYINDNPSQKRTLISTLGYFDLKNLGARIKNAKVIITSGTRDFVCPIEGIKSTLESIGSKVKEFYAINEGEHNSGGQFILDYQLKWLDAMILKSKLSGNR